MPVDELATFKERHADSLRAFRNAVESELLRIALIDDADVHSREKALTEERLRWEVQDIAGAMSRLRWPRILFGTIAGLASVAATATAAVGTGGVALAFAAPGVISAAYAAVGSLASEKSAESPLAFAALAHKSFGR